MLKTAFDDSSPKQVNKASQFQDDESDDNTSEYQKVFNIMQNWASETNTDLSHVYAAMNASQPLRDSLMIPTKLWTKLAPDIKKAIMDTRRAIENEEKKSPSNTQASSVPRQYSNPSRANTVSSDSQEESEHKLMMSSRTALKTQGLLFEESSDDKSDEYKSFNCHSYMARTLRMTDTVSSQLQTVA